MKNRNFVAKNMNTFNRPTAHKDKKYLEKKGKEKHFKNLKYQIH